MSRDQKNDLVKVSVIDSVWQGARNKIWHGPVTVGMGKQNLNSEDMINNKILKDLPTNGYLKGLDAAFQCSLAYLSRALW